MRWSTLLLTIALAISTTHAEDAPDPTAVTAMGILSVEFRYNGTVSSEKNPMVGHADNLWCIASLGGEAQKIETAKFTRMHDKKVFEPILDQDGTKASLRLGDHPAVDAGKYRCEITTVDGAKVHGNLFANAAPFFQSPPGMHLEQGAHSNRTAQANEWVYANTGELVRLLCPAYGAPRINYVWERKKGTMDKVRHSIKGNELLIKDAQLDDDDEYVCIARNTAMAEDGSEIVREARLTQRLRVSNAWGWLYPLIVIIIILLLLFIIIYACAACKKYKHDNYNVAKREKYLLRADHTVESSAASGKKNVKYELVQQP